MSRLCCFFLIVSALVSGPSVLGDDIEQHIRDQYLGKTFILRGFYNAGSLHFDSSGLARESASGDWTLDGVLQIKDIKLSRDRLRIRANRLHLGWIQSSGFGPVQDPPPIPGVDLSKERIVQIEYEFDSAMPSIDAADVAFSRIFLSSNDSFVDFVPDYWKPCVHAAVVESNDKNYAGCRFSQDFLAIPGVRTQNAIGSDASIQTVQKTVPSPGGFRVGGGISPPLPLFKPDPEFGDESRRVKYHGTILLGLIVEKDGHPSNVHIMRPLGCGLDAKAVQAVQGWKFKPAEKDGDPVRVEIAVEVEFHLY